MHVSILLPGPSLAALTTRPEADVTIAVKRAGTVYAADWLVVLDSPDLKAAWMEQVQGTPQLLTRREYRNKYTNRPGIDTETLEDLYPHAVHHGGSRWGMWSSTAALVLAAHLGATTVTAYGADFGEGDTLTEFDGFRSPEAKYDPARWAFEKQVWNDTARQIGIEVARYGFAG